MAAITICRSTRASATRRVSRDVAAARGEGKTCGHWIRNQSAGPHLKLGRGISRGAPSPVSQCAVQKKKHRVFDESRGIFSKKCRKFPKKRDDSYPDGENHSRTPVSSIRFSSIRRVSSRWKIFFNTRGHKRCPTEIAMLRCRAPRRPPLRCVTNARSNPENSGARGSRRDLVAPAPARLFPVSA